MITQISHSLDLSLPLNENEFSNINILDDRDNVHFCYQNIPFRFSVGQIESECDQRKAIIEISDRYPQNQEDLDFYWCELTYNLSKYDFIQLACMFPNIWEFHSEIVESDDKSITFYAFMENEGKENETKIYSLQEPESEHQKLSLNFNQNSYRIFEGLQDVKINFFASCSYLYANIQSENVFLADQSKDVRLLMELQKLTKTTETNYHLFFDIYFSCLVLENRIALFQIGNFTFQYEF